MKSTLRAVIKDGRIEPLETLELPEGSVVLVSLLPNDEEAFWLAASQSALDAVWDNSEDDVYAELLEE